MALRPALKAVDSQDGARDTRLTATHVIVVTAGFPDSASVSKVVWTGPTGVPIVTHKSPNADDLDVHEDNIGFKPVAAGPMPVTVTWQQDNGETGTQCAASASTTFQISAAKPLRPTVPRGNDASDPKIAAEYIWGAKAGPDSNRRPLVVRFRMVRGARLPGPRVPFRTTSIALLPSDPGWRLRRRIVLPFIQFIGGYEGSFVDIIMGIRNRTRNPRFGYELELKQGSRRVGRIRAAGQCRVFGCDFKTFRVER